MTVADLKLRIFRQIDSLEKESLEEFYGVLLNFINSRNDFESWEKLTEEQRMGLDQAIEEINSGKGISCEKVMERIKREFTRG